MTRPPRLVVLAGPNGAGKTTSAPVLLRDTLGVMEYINADTIRRRHTSGLANLPGYMEACLQWYYNASRLPLAEIAWGTRSRIGEITVPQSWSEITEHWTHEN